MAELPGLTSGLVIVALRAECGVIDKKRRLMPAFFLPQKICSILPLPSSPPESACQSGSDSSKKYSIRLLLGWPFTRSPESRSIRSRTIPGGIGIAGWGAGKASRM